MAGLLWRSLNHRCYDLQRGHAGTFNQSHDSVSGPPLPAAPVSVSREAEPTLDSQAGSRGSSPARGGGAASPPMDLLRGLKSRRRSESAQPVASVASPAAAEKITHTAS